MLARIIGAAIRRSTQIGGCVDPSARRTRLGAECYDPGVPDDERVGRWRIGATIHRGEWHDLVHAVDDRGAAAAVKRLHRHAARDPAAAALFAAEAALVTSLAPHPRVVRGVGADLADPDRPWLAMALIDGADLRQRAPTSPAQLIAWLIDACAGVAHLHDHGWLHGDLGPANLIVDGDDRLTVCDLGCARALGADGPVRGTHAYMAPEQLRGARWTPATDVFALGVILWELARGARLFFRGATYLTMGAVIEHAPGPLADPALDAIAQAALAKDPTDRTATPAELGAQLAALAARG
jgi:serine/threonine-protein kinase